MAAVLTQEGALALWRQLLGISPGLGAPFVRLIGQPHTIVHTDTQATLAAAELSVSGYAPLQLTQPTPSWQLAPISAGAQAAYPVLNWSLGGACTVYGYWLCDVTSQYSLWGEIFDAAFPLPGGGAFALQLQPTLISQP